MKVKKVRDLTLVDIDKEKSLVIACDSSGSIGMKEKDMLKIPPFYTGKFTLRVALMEVMCTGAKVVTVTDAVCCEMKPTGEEIIKGIKQELKEAGILDITLTGSTEENFETFSTGLGITVVGIAYKSKMKINNVKNTATLICVGLPKVGDEINVENDLDIVSFKDIKLLIDKYNALEMVPIGSKGILYEANLLAQNNNGALKLEKNITIDLNKSSGPATCMIAAVEEKYVRSIVKDIKNIHILGKIIKSN